MFASSRPNCVLILLGSKPSLCCSFSASTTLRTVGYILMGKWNCNALLSSNSSFFRFVLSRSLTLFRASFSTFAPSFVSFSSKSTSFLCTLLYSVRGILYLWLSYHILNGFPLMGFVQGLCSMGITTRRNFYRTDRQSCELHVLPEIQLRINDQIIYSDTAFKTAVRYFFLLLMILFNLNDLRPRIQFSWKLLQTFQQLRRHAFPRCGSFVR